jgi:hypothetical protein
MGTETSVLPENWGSVMLIVSGAGRVTESREALLLVRPGMRGEPALRWPSLWIAKCSLLGVVGRGAEPLMFCLRVASGVLRPKRASKESRLRYVRRADMRAAPRPVVGGSSRV